MPQLPLWSAETITGTEYRSQESGVTLTAGDQGVMLTPEEGKHVTVRAGAVAALLRWNDKKRTLIGMDGFVVQFDPGQWQDGDTMLRTVEAQAEPRLMVDLDEPGPESPRKDKAAAAQPAQPAVMAAAPRKRTPLQIWRLRLFRSLWALCLVIGVLAVLGGAVGGGIFFVVIGVAGIVGQQLLIRRRIRRLDDSGRQR